MEESFFNDDNLYIKDYIDIDDLGLNDDDALEALPLMDAILREEFTAVEDGSTMEDRPKIPTPLSIKAKGGLTALEFKHVAELPKYPRSHEQGYAYLIDLKGIPEDEISNRVNAHQYSHFRCNGSHIIYSPVLSYKVEKRVMQCSRRLMMLFSNKMQDSVSILI
ncbi:hypothetical protein N7495_007790 [Penicillium taxi]|uniref:uncharacterized protein n=1 Tax=Penicillium taxi TaxID=168475 RepID=UPI002545A438|nr:uncharacterized protein N7495_007790 [Penicillium taxi]KAJ5887749.1 hypothetical protein N7495_007790 [Penicillium taxi]